MRRPIRALFSSPADGYGRGGDKILNRQEKEELVREFHERFSRANAVFIAGYSEIKAVEMNEFRRSLRDSSVDFRIVRNTLARLALKGTDAERLAGEFSGPTAVAFCNDDVARGAKALVQFAKGHPGFMLKGGTLGAEAVGPEQIKGLAELPSREELLAKVVGSMSSPLSGLVGVLSGVPRKLVYVLNALKQNKAAG